MPGTAKVENGVDNGERLEKVFGAGHFAPGVTPESKDLMVRLVQQAVAVAQRVGANLPPGLSDQLIEIASDQLPPTHRTSMFADLLEGKRLEVESLNGTVVRLGREQGVNTPLNFAVYAALKPYVDGPPAMP